jgi:hypothetical protein
MSQKCHQNVTKSFHVVSMKRSNSYAHSLILTTALAAVGSAQSQINFTNLQILQGPPVVATSDSLAHAPSTPLTNTTTSFNIIDDTTATLYTGGPPPPATPTDLNDIILIANNSFTPNGTLTYTNPTNNSTVLNPGPASRIQHSQGYQAANSPANHQSTNPPPGPWTNNPGHVMENFLEVRFASHITVNNITITISSPNTAGVAWEYSLLQLLDQNMLPFNPVTGPGWTLGGLAQYNTAALTGGYNGLAGNGNIVMASTGTVLNVGGNTSSGTSGPLDGVASYNSLSDFNIPAGTRIGGFRFITWFEDVRGGGNGTTNFTSSVFDFTISGFIPEPGQVVGLSLLAVGMCVFALRRLSRSKTA